MRSLHFVASVVFWSQIVIAQTEAPQQLPGPEDIVSDPGQMDLSIPSVLEGIIEEYNYQGKDKRDPFAPYRLYAAPQEEKIIQAPPVSKLETFDIDQLKLIGVIWDVPNPKALIVTPGQETYTIFNNTRIGRNNGKVAEIREGEVVVMESFNIEGRQSYQPRLIRLQRE